ncbi:MAG: hypothetical protein CVV50_00450 [Spirochaetae bacterium HGW-Spirochaetae-6]|nr:MAG: hypothetical protein CVV50_00450 [Spirochaetae bacterium HGW-Spirochaetae-6]
MNSFQFLFYLIMIFSQSGSLGNVFCSQRELGFKHNINFKMTNKFNVFLLKRKLPSALKSGGFVVKKGKKIFCR